MADPKDDDLFKKLNEATEVALQKLREYFRGKSIQDMKVDFREYEFPELLYYRDISLGNEDYEINQAIKEVIQEKGAYLTVEVKKERDDYLFKELVNSDVPRKRLEPSIKSVIAEINLNNNISTRSSTNRTETFIETLSQLSLHYTEAVELKLVTEVLEYFKEIYNKRIKLGNDVITLLGDAECFVTVETDQENGLRYFLISMDSSEADFHNRFWEDVRRIFSEL